MMVRMRRPRSSIAPLEEVRRVRNMVLKCRIGVVVGIVVMMVAVSILALLRPVSSSTSPSVWIPALIRGWWLVTASALTLTTVSWLVALWRHVVHALTHALRHHAALLHHSHLRILRHDLEHTFLSVLFFFFGIQLFPFHSAALSFLHFVHLLSEANVSNSSEYRMWDIHTSARSSPSTPRKHP